MGEKQAAPQPGDHHGADTAAPSPPSSPAPSLPGADEPTQLHTIFDRRQKVVIVFLVATAATFSGFASNIYFPALPTVASDLNVSIELVNLSVTTYLIFQGLAPSVWGPLSDVKGRRIAYCCTFLVFLGACIGLAETKNYATLAALRCLQSAGSASTIAIGSGVIGDITTREERGGFMGIFQAGLLTPTAIGPIIGGALSDAFGWRSVFWFLAIYCGVFLVFLIALLPETLRSVIGNGSRVPSNILARYPLRFYQRTTKVDWSVADVDSSSLGPKKHVDVTGPFRILGTKYATPIVVFVAIYYAVWQMSITAMSSLFKEEYGLSDTHIGLSFIANGVGSMVGTLVTGKILDFDYRRMKKKHEIHIAVPIISTFITGWTSISMVSLTTTYLVDIFPDRGAAASASINLARCLFAAAGTSFIMPMVNSIGVGWAFTVCLGLQLVATLAAGIQWKFAGVWRAEAEKQAVSDGY
ncbi:unnamed protein product [Parascedosporium putredinis]|uniref:Major facilitator superfamily (MFS) profile domain-containing protein n=1 Tax=Parascedosporium putredinis TaxID=1442378 RepID=A0A9P1GZW3_9PEZI|nr:unnamed protein product [Parascedosporium putredinis]CAI7993299.1 unnamed protein product [Parascedosporium putredinis]